MRSGWARGLALIGVAVLGVVTLLGSGGGGGSDAPGSQGTGPAGPTAAIVVTAAPQSMAWAGETYISGIAAVTATAEAIQYRLGTGAPPGLTLDATTGALSWVVAAGTPPAKRTFDITIQATPSGASLAQPVTIEVLTPSVLIDTAVTASGGTFADKSGSYRVTVPADSLHTPGIEGRVSVQYSLNSEGRRAMRTRYSGFKAGTRISESFPRAVPSAASTTTSKMAVAERLAESGIAKWGGTLNEPRIKQRFQPDWLLYPNFYVPDDFDAGLTVSAAAAGGEFYVNQERVDDIAQLRRMTPGPGIVAGSPKPVAIFVHGFTVTHPLAPSKECPLGGKMDEDNTWGQPRALVERFADKYQVYEFQWRTCQPFEAAAGLLGKAIKSLFDSRLTDRKVTIFAHSFGGVVVSALLQKRFAGGLIPDIEPQDKIQAVYLFDSPVSGIVRTTDDPADRTKRFALSNGLPNGRAQDDWSIGHCGQITCFQMGFAGNEELNNLVAIFFDGVIDISPGAFTRSLIAGWSGFSRSSAGFSINVVFTDYPRRHNDLTFEDVEVAALVPGDGLIDNRGTALNIGHFEYSGALPVAAPGPGIKSIEEGYEDLHYLQRYYRSPEPGKRFAALPWVEEKPLRADGASSIKVYKVGSSYPARIPIPNFVNYYFSTDNWAHSRILNAAIVNGKDRPKGGYPGVVAYESSGNHLWEFFIAKAANDASSVELEPSGPSYSIRLVGRVVNESGAALLGMPYAYDVICVQGGVWTTIRSAVASTRSDGRLGDTIVFNTTCRSNAIVARLTIGDSINYRQYTDLVQISGSAGVYQATFNSGLDIRLIRMSDILAKPDTDLIFLTDLSGSYGDDLATFQSLSSAILNEARDNGARVRVGVASFVDFASWTGYSGDYPYFLWSGLDYDLAPARSAFARMYLANGGDAPESQLWALYSLTFLNWASGSQRIVAMATDASFHDRDVEPGYPGVGYAQTIAALRAKGIRVYILVPGGITVSALTRLATDTGGRVLNAGSGSSAVVCNFRAIFNGATTSACTVAPGPVPSAAAPLRVDAAGRSNQ